jgi:predicted RNase H-like HicB family nuclease
MIVEYIEAAMRRAEYKLLDEEPRFFGSIPAIEGVWAAGNTLESCRDELREVLEGWILLSVQRDLPIPALDGVSIRVASIEKPA